MNSKPIPMPWEILAGTSAIAGIPDAIRSGLQRQVEGYWQAQLQAVDAMQDLASGWFARRRDGIVAARAAATAVCAGGDPVEALRAYQSWATGCFERFTADVLAVQSQLTALAPKVATGMMQATTPATEREQPPQTKPRREAA